MAISVPRLLAVMAAGGSLYLLLKKDKGGGRKPLPSHTNVATLVVRKAKKSLLRIKDGEWIRIKAQDKLTNGQSYQFTLAIHDPDDFGCRVVRTFTLDERIEYVDCAPWKGIPDVDVTFNDPEAPASDDRVKTCDGCLGADGGG